jgi:DNA-binding GntR family transcriptional regulator
MSNRFDRETIDQLTRVNRRSDFVYTAIRDAIVYGRIKRGEWLREAVLSEELGVSRTSVRDALIRLIVEGLAVEVPYKGVRAASVSREEIKEVYTIRAMLESWAVEMAAGAITSQDLARMRELLPKSVAYADLKDFARTRESNREFHWTAIRATKMRHLIRLLEQIWEFMPTYVYYHELSEAERTELADAELRQHTQILEALEAGDGKLAGELTRQHILDTGTVKHMYSRPDVEPDRSDD